MTEQLKALMHDAADVDFPAVDLDAVTRDGDRRVRRRRGVTAVAGLAAATVIGAGAFAFLGGSERTDDAVDPADGIGSEVTWAVGSTLHTPAGSTDLGRAILAYVRTAEGIAFISDDRGVYSYDGDEPERIGTVSETEPRLISDTEDTRVGWVDDSGRLVVVDQATGDSVLDQEAQHGALRPIAIDGRRVYWRDGRYTYDLDVENRRGEPSSGVMDLLAVEDGAWALGSREGGVMVSRLPRNEGVHLEDSRDHETGVFSPDARWISLDGEAPRLFDTAHGEQIEIDVDGRAFATGYEFLDADTVMMIAGRSPKAKIELLRCEVPVGSCTAADADLGTFENPARFALPVGEAIGGEASGGEASGGEAIDGDDG